jgi:hypothetical protein
MEQQQKFKLYVVFLSLAIGLITVLEIFNANLFAELFIRMSNNAGWILGLTVGMVVPDILVKIRSKIKRVVYNDKVDERFVIFIANAALLAFVVSLARGIVMVFLQSYYEFFHIILVQWLVLVYLWFKFINGFRISARYIVSTEIILVIFTAVLLFAIK